MGANALIDLHHAPGSSAPALPTSQHVARPDARPSGLALTHLYLAGFLMPMIKAPCPPIEWPMIDACRGQAPLLRQPRTGRCKSQRGAAPPHCWGMADLLGVEL